MRSHRSAQLGDQGSLHTLELHLGPNKGFLPLGSRFFPLRPSRTPKVSPLKNNKKIQIIQTMDFFKTETKKRSPQPLCSSRASSYLIYKQEQLSSKMHKNVYLKPKSKCHPRSLSSDRGKSLPTPAPLSSTLSPPRTIKTISKIELTLSEDTPAPIMVASRQFYIKTGEGKRQRITAGDYQRKVQQRVRSQSTPPLALRLDEYPLGLQMEYTDTPFFCTVNEVRVHPKQKELQRRKPILKSSTGRLRVGACPAEEAVSCRPWTSTRSDRSQ